MVAHRRGFGAWTSTCLPSSGIRSPLVVVVVAHHRGFGVWTSACLPSSGIRRGAPWKAEAETDAEPAVAAEDGDAIIDSIFNRASQTHRPAPLENTTLGKLFRRRDSCMFGAFSTRERVLGFLAPPVAGAGSQIS